MRQHVVSLLVMLFPVRRASRPTTDEVTERLLAGREVPPGANASERALSRVLTAAARPGTEAELAGEAGAVAAFLLAAGPAAARQAQQARTRPRRISRRVPVLAVGFAIAIVVGLYGTAAANALPPPLQQLAHSMGLHVPAPAGTGTPPGTANPATGQSGVPTLTSDGSHPASTGTGASGSPSVTPTGTSASGTPTPSATPSSNGNGNGNGNSGNGNGNSGSGNGNSGTGNGNGNSGSGNGNSGTGNVNTGTGNGNTGTGNGNGNGLG